MHFPFQTPYCPFEKKIMHTAIVSLCWFFSMLLGLYIATQADVRSFSQMLTLSQSRMSILSLLCVTALPLLISVVAFRLGHLLLLLLVVCIKAYAFAFSCGIISVYFADAGWLLRWLLIFTDSVLVIPLLCYWFQNLIDPSRSAHKGVIHYLFISFVVVYVDYSFVTPIAMKLL